MACLHLISRASYRIFAATPLPNLSHDRRISGVSGLRAHVHTVPEPNHTQTLLPSSLVRLSKCHGSFYGVSS